MADMPSGLHENSRPARPATQRTGGNAGGRHGGVPGPWDGGLYTPEGNRETGGAGRGSAASGRGGRERQDERPGWAGEDGAGQRREEQQRENDNPDSADSRAGKGSESGGEDSDEEIDYYEVLDIPHNATPSQIRSAYHTLSRLLHPDKQPPEFRDRATAEFNHLVLAYETLNNPHRRIIYDTLGVEGLKQKHLELGIKALSPEEFKVWLQEQVRKQGVAEVMSLVGSRSDLSITVDVCSWRFKEGREFVGEDGATRYRVVNLPPASVSRYLAKHSFMVPMEGLGRILVAPIPSFKEFIGSEKPQQISRSAVDHVPTLTFHSAVKGRPYTFKPQGVSRPGTMLASPTLAVSIAHTFPTARPNAPTSVSTYLSGLGVDVTGTFYPTRVVASSFSRSFGASRLVVKTIFNHSPVAEPPAIEISHARRVSQRGSVFMTFYTGSMKWPSAISQILSRPGPASHFTIGYTSSPLTPGEEEDDGTKAAKSLTGVSRSKKTESWSIIGSAGLMLGGEQLGLQYGRTFYVGTQIGSERFRIAPRGPPTRSYTGIRLSAEGSFGLMGLLSWELKASRKVFTYSSVGIGVGIGSGAGSGWRNGVIFKVHWSRLGQQISVPLIVAPIPELESLVYATIIPVVGYVLLETFLLRPRERRQRAKQIEKYKSGLKLKMEKRKKKAEESIEMFREVAERRQSAQSANNGLVIISAGYGVRGKPGEWVDVTVSLAMLVTKDGQMVIPRKFNKSHIRGFYDPAPSEEKQLWVRYLFAGVTHEAVVGDSDALTIPLRQHLVE